MATTTRPDTAQLAATPLAGSLGAEVRGVRLDELDDDGFAALCDVFWEHQVLVVRDQHLEPTLSCDGTRSPAGRRRTSTADSPSRSPA